MKLLCVAGVLAASALAISPALAASVTLNEYTDDYGVLSIDGLVVGSYDGYPAANIIAPLNLSDGWHTISIDYENRYGTNFLNLDEEYAGASGYSVVPLLDFQSTDQSGNTISGLRADYYSLDGTFQFTVYGEGPIANGALSFTQEMYEGQPGLWAGVFGPGSDFEERLSGEIYFGPDSSNSPAPEPGSLLLLAGTAIALPLRRLILRKRQMLRDSDLVRWPLG